MNRTRSRLRSRRGTVLVGVLACLSVVIAMVMVTVQSSLRGRKQVRQQRQLVQTELLCEAGVKRAIQQWTKSPNYVGEQWTPRLRGTPFESAVVSISVRPLADKPDFARAEVTASLASSETSVDRMQRSHSFEIKLPKPSPEIKP